MVKQQKCKKCQMGSVWVCAGFVWGRVNFIFHCIQGQAIHTHMEHRLLAELNWTHAIIWKERGGLLNPQPLYNQSCWYKNWNMLTLRIILFVRNPFLPQDVKLVLAAIPQSTGMRIPRARDGTKPHCHLLGWPSHVTYVITYSCAA